jgi:hypothetical protein
MRISYRVHALQRMFQRDISNDDVRYVIENGRIIEDYPDDTPYPSRLLLGMVGARPLHVVVAVNAEADETIVITAYEPDSDLWQEDFTERRRT